MSTSQTYRAHLTEEQRRELAAAFARSRLHDDVLPAIRQQAAVQARALEAQGRLPQGTAIVVEERLVGTASLAEVQAIASEVHGGPARRAALELQLVHLEADLHSLERVAADGTIPEPTVAPSTLAVHEARAHAGGRSAGGCRRPPGRRGAAHRLPRCGGHRPAGRRRGPPADGGRRARRAAHPRLRAPAPRGARRRFAGRRRSRRRPPGPDRGVPGRWRDELHRGRLTDPGDAVGVAAPRGGLGVRSGGRRRRRLPLGAPQPARRPRARPGRRGARPTRGVGRARPAEVPAVRCNPGSGPDDRRSCPPAHRSSSRSARRRPAASSSRWPRSSDGAATRW